MLKVAKPSGGGGGPEFPSPDELLKALHSAAQNFPRGRPGRNRWGTKNPLMIGTWLIAEELKMQTPNMGHLR